MLFLPFGPCLPLLSLRTKEGLFPDGSDSDACSKGRTQVRKERDETSAARGQECERPVAAAGPRGGKEGEVKGCRSSRQRPGLRGVVFGKGTVRRLSEPPGALRFHPSPQQADPAAPWCPSSTGQRGTSRGGCRGARHQNGPRERSRQLEARPGAPREVLRGPRQIPKAAEKLFLPSGAGSHPWSEAEVSLG